MIGDICTGGAVDEFANVLNLVGVPARARPAGHNPLTVFADLGAWHGYGLPDAGHAGGFTGPLYVAEEYPWWLSAVFSRLGLTDLDTGEPVELTLDSADALPGRLRQVCVGGGLTVTLGLWYTSHRGAVVEARVRHDGDGPRRLAVSWTGALLPHEYAPTLRATDTGVAADFREVRDRHAFLSTTDARFEVHHDAPVITVVTGAGYRTDRVAPLAVHGEARLTWQESYTFTAGERDRLAVRAEPPDARWARYLARALDGVAPERRRLAVKAVTTLVTNWRSPAGALRRDGVTPSLSSAAHNGFWSWDSWKHAAGVAAFDPALAASVIESVFDHQRDDGMVPDAVFYNRDGVNWNERNTKPPLAAWAVWQVYHAGRDLAFLRRLYPRLVAYHRWWYDARDRCGFGICSYGATLDPANDTDKAVAEAASWESGTDSAPRFDDVTVLPGRTGFTIDQESVCLNAYLAAEKDHLTLIARAVGSSDTFPSKQVASYVRDRMYDAGTGWFYDTIDGQPLVDRGKGVEGVIPLWAGIATLPQTVAVRAALLDPARFGTPVPCPSVAADSPAFAPERHWRGPVWLDQLAFAVEGLRRAGFSWEADALTEKVFANADGLAGDAPLHENYHPLTGARQGAPNFSWSAAAVLLLLRG